MSQIHKNQSLPLPSPDFDDIKNSLKDFMRQYEGLEDYDFEGSTISILLDTLAYNTHLNTFWLNMIGNEAFLQTAIKRNNVVNAARDLGYMPKTAKSAHTELYIEYEPDRNNLRNSVTIEAGSTFSASTNNISYTFNVLDDTPATYSIEDDKYIVDNLKVYEGRLLVHEWTVVPQKVLGQPNEIQDVTIEGLEIPNVGVDADIMRVYVLDNSISPEYILYSKFDGSLNVDENSKIYFLSESENGLLNVTFGDGVLGYKPQTGSKIKVVYVIASGPGANGIAQFSQTSYVEHATPHKIIPKYPAGGGAFAEKINSIKYNAQLNYESQGRGVVAQDYEYLVRQAYPNAKRVIAWGGQDNNPPQYGKTFISIQPETGLVITESEIESIVDYVSRKNVTTVEPVIVNPDYIFIDITSTVRYDISQTSLTAGALENQVKKSIEEFSENRLNSYNKNLEYSRLLGEIDNAVPGILSNNTDFILSKRLHISDQGYPDIFILNFGNEIEQGSINTTPFSYSSFDVCYFEENSKGQLSIVTNMKIGDKIKKVNVVEYAGDINYEKGIINLNSLQFYPKPIFFNNILKRYYIKFYVKPKSNNVSVKHNQILNIENINVKAQHVTV